MGINDRASERPPDMFPKEHFEAIGRLIVARSRLDAVFTDLICSFSNLSANYGLILVHHQTFASKYDAFMAILREIADGAKVQSKEVDNSLCAFSVARVAYNYRNRVAHGLWPQPLSGAPEVQKFTSQGRLQVTLTRFPTEEVLQKAEEVMAGCDNLVELREHMLSLYNYLEENSASRLG